MTLYEIDHQVDEIRHNAVDPETGAVNDDAIAQLDALLMERNTKVENVALWVKNLTAENKAIRDEEKNLADRRKVNENLINRLTAWLEYALDGSKFSTPRCSISYRASQAVEVDAEHLAKKYCRVKLEPDKTLLKQLLKEGKKIRGAILVARNNISIK